MEMDTSEPCANFFKENTMMIGSMGLVASLPLGYLEWLDNLPMKKKNMTGWVHPPPKWNKMKRAMVKAARMFNMTTLRMKTLVSGVGLKIKNRDLDWIPPSLGFPSLE